MTTPKIARAESKIASLAFKITRFLLEMLTASLVKMCFDMGEINPTLCIPVSALPPN